MKKRTAYVAASVVVATLFFFQNCGKFASITDLAAFSTFSRAPFGEEVDAGCLNNPKYQACLINKNPVETLGEDWNSNWGDQLSNNQTIGIWSDEMQAAGRSIRIGNLTVTSLRESSAEPDIDRVWREVFVATNGGIDLNYGSNMRLAKIHVLFWAAKAKRFAFENFRTPEGQTPEGLNLPITIVVDAEKTGWSSQTRTIFLGKNAAGESLAMDGSVVVHLVGEALLHSASLHNLYELSQTQTHTDCRFGTTALYGLECCRSENGCLKAITAGFSDVFANSIFPASSSVGEFASGDRLGAKVCSLRRNAAVNSDLTAAAAHTGCASSGQPGNTYALGILMAAIWHAVLKDSRDAGQDPASLFQLYGRIAVQLEPQDTFTTLLAKIRAIDAQSFEGRWTARFEAEYARRGLAIP